MGAGYILVFFTSQVDLGGAATALVGGRVSTGDRAHAIHGTNVELNGIPAQMDLLLRFETLESDFAVLAKRLGIETGATFPHRNKGYTPENWRHYYLTSPDLIDFVAERFAEDIQMFGYDATWAPLDGT